MSENSKKKTVILHVGRHKTGTTTIQSVFKTNIVNFRKRGLHYPKCLPACHSSFFLKAFGEAAKHPVHGRFGLSQAQIRADAQEMLKNIRKEVRHFDGDKILFSGEDAGTCLLVPHLELLKKEMRHICGEEPNYRILYFTRDPVSRAESGLQQLIKGNRMTEEDALEFQLEGGGKRHKTVYEIYAEAFGDKAVEFYSYEAARAHPGGLAAFFLDKLDLSIDGLNNAEARRNTSISGEVLKFLSWLYEGPRVSPAGGRRLQYRDTRAPVTDHDRAVLFNLAGATATFLSADDRQKIWDVVADDMAFLKERFGIEYTPPKERSVAKENLFGPNFRRNLEAALPELNSDLRTAFETFLKTYESSAVRV